jgi:hypothetical protein
LNRALHAVLRVAGVDEQGRTLWVVEGEFREHGRLAGERLYEGMGHGACHGDAEMAACFDIGCRRHTANIRGQRRPHAALEAGSTPQAEIDERASGCGERATRSFGRDQRFIMNGVGQRAL